MFAEFSISIVPGNNLGKLVYGTSEGDLSNVEEFQYWEVQDSSWHKLEGDRFGPAGGFPLVEATSRFRVKFKEAGTTTVKFIIKTVDDDSVLLEQELTFVCE